MGRGRLLQPTVQRGHQRHHRQGSRYLSDRRLQPAGGTLYLRENAGRENAVGVEGEASHPFGPNINLRVGFAYTHARVDAAERPCSSQARRPAETPDLVGHGRRQWRLGEGLILVSNRASKGPLRRRSERAPGQRRGGRSTPGRNGAPPQRRPQRLPRGRATCSTPRWKTAAARPTSTPTPRRASSGSVLS